MCSSWRTPLLELLLENFADNTGTHHSTSPSSLAETLKFYPARSNLGSKEQCSPLVPATVQRRPRQQLFPSKSAIPTSTQYFPFHPIFDNPHQRAIHSPVFPAR